MSSTDIGCKQKIKNFVYETIKEKIITCTYRPGSVLNETQLASEFGLSRTPIREATTLLESEGFLQIIAKKGILVTDILLSDVAQIFQVRMEIEPLALKLSAPNITRDEILHCKKLFTSETIQSANCKQNYKHDLEMHKSFVTHCNNIYIIDMMKKVFDKNMRIITYSSENKAHLQKACQDHIEILDFILKNDFDSAAEKLRSHIAECRNAAFDFFYS